jgi:hypothetical protein
MYELSDEVNCIDGIFCPSNPEKEIIIKGYFLSFR